MNAAFSASTSPANEAGELRLVEKKIAVFRWQDWRHGCVRRGIFDEGVHRLAFVWSEGSNVNKADNLWIGTSLGNYRATVGVAHQDDRAILFVDNEPRETTLNAQPSKACLNGVANSQTAAQVNGCKLLILNGSGGRDRTADLGVMNPTL